MLYTSPETVDIRHDIIGMASSAWHHRHGARKWYIHLGVERIAILAEEKSFGCSVENVRH